MNDVYTLPQIFAGHLFRIPAYQRGYAWEPKQCQELLEDLEALPLGKRHHCGTLTLQMCPDRQVTDAAGSLYEVVDIVDGQQRLTSLMILLNAVGRELALLGDQGAVRKAQGIRQTYIATEDSLLQPLPKLTLNSDCQPLFSGAVLGLGGATHSAAIDGARIRSHELLLAARDHFAGYLQRQKAERGDGFGPWLEELRVKLTQQLTFLMYPATEETDAGVLFETMNNRGKKVTELELVKNYLLYLASKLDVPGTHNLPAMINGTWTKLYESLMAAGLAEPEDEEQLLRGHWLMAYDYRRENWQKSKSIKAHFDLKRYRDRHLVLLQDLRKYLGTLSSAVTAFCDVYAPLHPQAFNDFKGQQDRDEAVRLTEKLDRIGVVAPFLPLLMACRLARQGDAAAYAELAGLLERFSFRVFSFMRVRSGTAESSLYRLGNGLYAGASLESVLEELRRLVHDYCPDSELTGRFDREGANWFRWGGLKYFLYEYEEHLARLAGKQVFEELPWLRVAKRSETIEHILPQHPAEAGYWVEHWTQAERDTWTHDIGNLCLTYDNSWLSNRPFPEKRAGDPNRPMGAGYERSFVFQERYVGGYGEWTTKELAERRQAIKTWAVERWYVKQPAKQAPANGFARIQQVADGNGIGEAYGKVVAEAERLGLYLRPHKVCMVLAPRTHKNRAVFAIWPVPGKLKIGQWFGEMEKYLKVPQAETKRILGDNIWRFVDNGGAEAFVEDLGELMSVAGLAVLERSGK